MSTSWYATLSWTLPHTSPILSPDNLTRSSCCHTSSRTSASWYLYASLHPLSHPMCFVLGGHSYLLLLLFAFLLFLLLVSSFYVLSSSWNVSSCLIFSSCFCSYPCIVGLQTHSNVQHPKLYFATVDPSLFSKPIGQQEPVFGLPLSRPKLHPWTPSLSPQYERTLLGQEEP